METLGAILATALALSLYVVFAFRAGALWRDEVNTVVFATLPSLGEIWAALVHDTVPLVSTLALRLWTTVVPATDFGLRIFGLLVHTAFLGAVWTSARLLGSASPVVALALLSVNPTIVREVGSLRPYGLGSVFIALTLGLVWRCVQHPSRSNLVLACLFAVLSVQTLFTNAILLAVVCVAGAVVAMRGSGWTAMVRPLAIGLVAALSIVPYLGTLLRGREDLMVGQLAADWPWYWTMIQRVLGAGIDWIVWLWLILIGLALLAAGRTQLPRSRASVESRDLTLYAGIVIALAAPLFVVSMKSANLPTHPWYYAPLLTIVAIALDAMATSFLEGNRGRIGKLILLGLVTAGMAGATWSDLSRPQSNLDTVAAYLEANAGRNDLIVVSPWYLGISFNRYYEGNTPWTTIPPIEDHTIHRYDLLRREMMAVRTAIDPLLFRIERTLRSGDRVWVVGSLLQSGPGGPPPDPPPPPHPVSGWQNAPYQRHWLQKTGDYLASHATSRQIIPFDDGRPPAREDARLLALRGWR